MSWQRNGAVQLGLLVRVFGTAALAADNMPLPAPAAIGFFQSRQCAAPNPAPFAIAGPGARRHHRQTPRGGRGSACRSDCAAPAGGSRQRDPAARPADASGARGLAEAEIEKWWPIIRVAGIRRNERKRQRAFHLRCAGLQSPTRRMLDLLVAAGIRSTSSRSWRVGRDLPPSGRRVEAFREPRGERI